MNAALAVLLEAKDINLSETQRDIEDIRGFVDGINSSISILRTYLLSKLVETERKFSVELFNIRDNVEKNVSHLSNNSRFLLTEADVRRILKEVAETKVGDVNWIVGVSEHSRAYKESYLNYFSLTPPKRSPKMTFSRKNCWPMEGSSGFIQYELQEGVFVRTLTLEHIHYSQRTVLGSVPKDFLIDGSPDRGGTWLNLGSHTYNSSGPAIQYFNISYSQLPITSIKLIVKSNYGEKFTCLYGVTVQGERT